MRRLLEAIVDDGERYVRLELQTRAAYEVWLGDDAPTRVIGVLRVHGVSAYREMTDDLGVSGVRGARLCPGLR